MPENTGYFDSIAARRALAVSQEDSLEGGTLLSIETCSEFSSEDDFYSHLVNHFEQFIRYVRLLAKREQDLAISYYVLGMTQSCLGKVFGMTQTACSFQLRLIVRCLGAFIMFGGNPTEDQLREILSGSGLSTVSMLTVANDGERIAVPLASVIAMYLKERNFRVVAEHFGVHRPEIRRHLRQLASLMQDAAAPTSQAVGAWLQLLVDRMSAVSSGYSECAKMHLEDLYRKDPDITGEFRISIADMDFGHLFTSKAER